MRRLAAALALALAAAPALAATPALTPAQEARAETIAGNLRCVVCQGESVAESNAALAADMRRIIRRQVAEGRTNRQIMAWMTARYGDFIRLDPPFDRFTLLLWSVPVLAPAVGLAAALLARRRAARPFGQPAGPPLSEAEKARLAELLE
ncbi:MAG TPA: cytochrome c-type biogenesis protein [Acetobacteraceae bacterium]|jgi:cytochrome c-type biogenesis protein CcmH|nr:cytochrome c-type biogenesis protein [Acetobacteraceae bacterium]